MIDQNKFVDAVLNQIVLTEDKEFDDFMKSIDPNMILALILFFDQSYGVYAKMNIVPAKALFLTGVVFYFMGFRDGVKDQKEVNELEKVNHAVPHTEVDQQT